MSGLFAGASPFRTALPCALAVATGLLGLPMAGQASGQVARVDQEVAVIPLAETVLVRPLSKGVDIGNAETASPEGSTNKSTVREFNSAKNPVTAVHRPEVRLIALGTFGLPPPILCAWAEDLARLGVPFTVRGLPWRLVPIDPKREDVVRTDTTLEDLTEPFNSRHVPVQVDPRPFRLFTSLLSSAVPSSALRALAEGDWKGASAAARISPASTAEAGTTFAGLALTSLSASDPAGPAAAREEEKQDEEGSPAGPVEAKDQALNAESAASGSEALPFPLPALAVCRGNDCELFPGSARPFRLLGELLDTAHSAALRRALRSWLEERGLLDAVLDARV